jgi:hypothetical protein
VVKECGEEAGIPEHLARQARPVGYVSYASMQPEGLKPDVLFTYDIKLPEVFVPQPQDGEVSALPPAAGRATHARLRRRGQPARLPACQARRQARGGGAWRGVCVLQRAPRPQSASHPAPAG